MYIDRIAKKKFYLPISTNKQKNKKRKTPFKNF